MFSEEIRILVIEEKAVTELVDTFLTATGYTVAVENDGKAGLERVKTFKPQLILLGVEIPGMDGYDVCSALRKDPQTADTPVVFLTGKDTRDDQGRSFKSGGNLLVRKPFSCERLLDIVKIVLLSVNK